MFWFHRKNVDKEFISFFKNILGFRPRREELYRVALTHKSVSRQTSQGKRVNNERLEYLGDAILGSIVAEYLYRRYPYKGEGFLTVMRSKIVSRMNLNTLAKKIGLSELVEYNKEQHSIFKSKDGDAFEALVGAIYLERGYKFTQRVIINRILNAHMDLQAIEQQEWNYKSKLIDWGQKERCKVHFEVVKKRGQGKGGNYRIEYEVLAWLGEERGESAVEYSIKAAEQLAAEKTYKKMEAEGRIAKNATATEI